MRGEFMYFSKGEDLVYKYVLPESSHVVELFFPLTGAIQYHADNLIFNSEEDIAIHLDCKYN